MCGLCVLWELQAKEIQVQESLPDKLQFTLLSLHIPDEPFFMSLHQHCINADKTKDKTINIIYPS